MQKIAILGSTGSIGCNSLEVIRHNIDKYQVFALTAHSQVEKLLKQCIEFKPQYAVIGNEIKAQQLREQLKNHNIATTVLSNHIDISTIVAMPEIDVVISAIVGAQGLHSTYTAILNSKKVLLANKESLVAAGKLITQVLQQNSKSQLIPIDSEHSAILQSLPHDYTEKKHLVSSIILTASGGPFYQFSAQQLQNVTPDMALRHPNWTMGKKITIDSSTLMNKGLEVIEAYWLFGIDKLEVVIHPQSIIHSMVEYIDGSVIAQLGTPDMKTPIAYALAYPNRIVSGSPKINFKQLKSLTFDVPDYDSFPCLKLAFEALKMGRAAPAILNAANEVAVAAFLAGKIKFYAINDLIEKALNKFVGVDYFSIDEVLQIDKECRKFAQSQIVN
ncbi:MAG: 1-deoxy-D-xylulose-5-phosphate reductoisomerase [Burkholderiales bacterium]|nr:1-deoxy-D-xylulose-5-phosphate reductoisomerase [Burkholderiales bacterium]